MLSLPVTFVVCCAVSRLRLVYMFARSRPLEGPSKTMLRIYDDFSAPSHLVGVCLTSLVVLSLSPVNFFFNRRYFTFLSQGRIYQKDGNQKVQEAKK